MSVLGGERRTASSLVPSKPVAVSPQRIVKAETILVSIPFESGGTPPWSFGGSPRLQFDTLFVRLETEGGIVGWGEAFSRGEDKSLASLVETRGVAVSDWTQRFRNLEIKFDLEFQLQNFGRVGPPSCTASLRSISRCGISLAKPAVASLSTLLGGAFTDEVEVYASLMRYGNRADVVKATRQAVERGYRYIKLHEITEPEIVQPSRRREPRRK